MIPIPKIPMPSPRTVMLIVALLLFGFLAWYGPTACQQWRDQKTANRLQKEQGKATTASGRDAVGTATAAGQREADSESLTRTNEREIRAAEGANAPVDPAVSRAGRAALCRREANRNRPECKGN